ACPAAACPPPCPASTPPPVHHHTQPPVQQTATACPPTAAACPATATACPPTASRAAAAAAAAVPASTRASSATSPRRHKNPFLPIIGSHRRRGIPATGRTMAIKEASGVPSVLLPSEPNEFDMRSISFVYRLPSRGKQCFYHKASSNFTFEYQVTSGGSLDIDVFINSPGGKLAFDRRGKAYGEASFAFDPAKSTADMRLPAYMICLDNRYSSWHDKLVNPRTRWRTTLLRTIYLLSKEPQQRGPRSHDDGRETMPGTWSIFQLVVMLFVSGIQVMMIRSLFDDKSRLHRVWKAGKS
uniref:GOLD domain-containing protein n=1 Tax=Macrostomum lignano TaxID=282301 RepID=A0A1I8FQ55_9PLAT